MPATLPDFKTLLETLISIPSVSCTNPHWDMSNRGVVEKLAEWLELLEFDTELIPVPGHIEKFNLLAVRGSGPGGLVLSGHTDTVPFDESRWSFNPTTITDKDHRFYGIGTADMKGFFPVVLEAIRRSGDLALQQPLMVLATADEESSMSGARCLAELGKPKARYAVIGEPTGLAPVRMHKGIMMEAVKVVGRSGHSSDPHLGINAMEIMHEVMTELFKFRNELQQRNTNPQFRIPYPTMNFGHIHGGDNPNRICGQCEINFDFRSIPGLDNLEVRERIDQALAPVRERHEGAQIEYYPLIHHVDPFRQSEESDLVKVAERLSGYTAQSVAFATEAPFLQSLGMDTIVLGPGSIDQAHQPDEFLAHNQIEPAIDLIQNLIQRFCVEPARES